MDATPGSTGPTPELGVSPESGTDDASDRSAVLELVTLYFGDPDSDGEKLLGGVLLEWARATGEVSWHERYQFNRTLEQAEVRELTDCHAVVEVKARFEAKLKRGSAEYVLRADGPVQLEKRVGEWRIVDLVIQGRRRSDSIVLGALAEQHQVGVSARVVGLDRHATGTSFLVEIGDVEGDDVRLVKAYALVEHDTLWSRMSIGSRDPVPAGDTRRILVHSEHEISLEETMMAVALDVRSASRRLPFVIKVPPQPPDPLVPQPTAKRLPPLRGSWPRHLLIYTAITAAVGWWYGWLAILVPCYLALSFYWQVRVRGFLPLRLERCRFVLDTTVVAATFAGLWLTPCVVFAVPFLVAAAVFLLLTPLGPRRHRARISTSLAVGVAWFFLLGTETGALSPCRLVAGSPARFSDSFARAVLTRNAALVERYSASRLPLPAVQSLERAYVAKRPDAVLETRGSLAPSNQFCHSQRGSFGAIACYGYKLPGIGGGTEDLVVAVQCDGRTWRVSEWF